MRDEVPDPAFVLELDLLAAGALVREDDVQPRGQEGRFAQPLDQRLSRVVDLLEHLGVGEKADDRPALLGEAHLLELAERLSTRELLAVDRAVGVDFRD